MYEMRPALAQAGWNVWKLGAHPLGADRLVARCRYQANAKKIVRALNKYEGARWFDRPAIGEEW